MSSSKETKSYRVTLSRVTTEEGTIEVLASSEEEAQQLALMNADGRLTTWHVLSVDDAQLQTVEVVE